MSNSTTLLDTIAPNQANKEVVVNALLDAASPAMLWGRHASACSGLTWGYYGGQYGANAIANGTVTLTASATNYVYADNATGAVSVNTTGTPTGKISLYTIVAGATTVTSYTDLRQAGGGGSGSVTSVALTAPTQFAVAGSPVTGAGTLGLTWIAQAVNTVFAGPSSGASGVPTFRALVAADLPVMVASGASHAAGAVPDPGATAGTTRFLREDATWQVPPGSGGSSTLAGLTDVNVSPGPGINGYSLTWNNATSKWVATNVSGGGGGSSISEGTYASRPAAGTAGRLYLATDGEVLSYDNGTTWDLYAPLIKVSSPLSPFAVANFATTGVPAVGSLGTVHSDANAVLGSASDYLDVHWAATASAGNGMNGYTQAAPTGSNWRVGFLVAYDGIGGAYCGPAWGFTDGTKFHTLGLFANTAIGANLETWSNNTTRAGFTPANGLPWWYTHPIFWLGLRYDGTTYYFEFSLDRKTWFPLNSTTGGYLSSYSTMFFGASNLSGAGVSNRAIRYYSVDPNS